jgi:hypothetical protein
MQDKSLDTEKVKVHPDYENSSERVISGEPSAEISKARKIELDRSFSELHDCEKSHGKIVMIEVDVVGVERCGYCHKPVDYSGWFLKQLFRL